MDLRWPARLSLAIGSGFGLALAFPSYNYHLLVWIAPALLMLAAFGARPRNAALLGFLHGAAGYPVMVSWIATVMRVHGGVAPLAAAGILGLLVAAWTVFPAAFAWCFAWLAQRSVLRACLAAPCIWVALEFARTHLPIIGFPWNLLGYAASENLALVQLTALTGIYGLTFLVAAYNSTLVALLVASRTARNLAAMVWLVFTAATVLVATAGPSFVPVQPAKHVAHLVQPNFPQSAFYPMDWMAVHAGEMDELERLSIGAAAKAPGLVVWPEVPAPFSLQDAQFAARANRIARAGGHGFLLGEVDWRPGLQGGMNAYNSAALLDTSGRSVFRYDKIHLVPFGEYVPLRRWLTFAGKLTADIGDFQAGTSYTIGTLPDEKNAGRFGVFICYEAAFPALVRQFTANGAELLVNLSNDGWFGRSAAPEQHLMMARVRAVENRRWLLRDTNNGFTVSVDPYGRLAAALEADVRGVLEAPYGFRSDRTLYVRWGDWLAWAAVFGALGLMLISARKDERGSRDGKVENRRPQRAAAFLSRVFSSSRFSSFYFPI